MILFPESSVRSLKLICPYRYVNRQRLDLVSLQNSKAFQDLDHNVQKVIKVLSHEPKTLEELSDLIQIENEKTREHVSGSFREHEKRLAEEEYRTRFLESLWFPEILSREENIADAHSKTFQWIFDKSDQAVRPWGNFIAWLEGRQGTYWISGKAGSGKSTLMNLISQDERTRDALKVWSGTKDILTPKFFFWSSGTSLQKSLEGLLRSLLWQILHEFPIMNSLSFNVGPGPEQSRRAPREHSLIGAWTKPRLLRLLKEVINQLQSSYYLCFFIDGLDEFDEDDDDLIAFVQGLVSSAGVKVCSSSRPHKVFEDALGFSPKLRLQDLTYKDIQRYVNDKFQAVPRLKSMTLEDKYQINKVKEEIVTRSEGVFLWVSLAVKDQIRGLRNDDSPEQLQERLADLPNEIEGIYVRMLHQIDKPYRQEASCFLKMALHRPRMSVLDHALASYKGLENMLLSADAMSEREVVLLCQSTRKKLITRCAGLLEIIVLTDQDTENESTSKWISDSSDLDPEPTDADLSDGMSASDPIRETVGDSNREKENEQPTQELDREGSFPASEHEITDDKALEVERKTKVTFIHRTAFDFLDFSGPGRDFLEANLSPDFDPQVLSIKMSLGFWRLRGYFKPEIDKPYPDSVLSRIAILEDKFGAAQTGLCELLDRTMSIIDRSHLDWSPESHWCTRWGELADHYLREQDAASSSPTLSSRSSSRDSFYSAPSEPTVPGDSNAAPPGSINFLSFAASHSLSLYVHHVLEFSQPSINSETLDFSLYCSTLLAGFSEYSVQAMPKTVLELLRRGANPNARFKGNTAWREFLKYLVELWTRSLRNGLRSTSFHDMAIQPLALATIAFVEHGADVGLIWTKRLFQLESRSQNPSFECIFDLQASPSSTIELCMRNAPEMPRIRKLCDTRGAFRYLRCPTLRFDVDSQTEEDEVLRKEFMLSEQESEDFLRIFESSTEPSGAWDAGAFEKLTSQLLALYNRLNESHPDSSSASLTGTSVA